MSGKQITEKGIGTGSQRSIGNVPATAVSNSPLPDYFHGSTSAGLMDVLRSGLIPTGLQEVVSFAGEMMGGIMAGNMNWTHTSVVEPGVVARALDYAQKNLAGWHPDRSNQLLKFAEHCLYILLVFEFYVFGTTLKHEQYIVSRRRTKSKYTPL